MLPEKRRLTNPLSRQTILRMKEAFLISKLCLLTKTKYP
jgi:hypothetical protein